MRIDPAINIEDLHRMAKRRLPKIAFDFSEERNIRNGVPNIRGGLFRALSLKPSILAEAPTQSRLDAPAAGQPEPRERQPRG
jgi:hypothetical protein